ncbi:MAG: DUF4476 domain-containing protein [Flavobacteriales bacterium]
MKLLLSAFFIFIQLVSLAQSKIEFRSADTLAFFIKIEGQKVNILPSSDLSFLWNKPGKQSFNIKFADSRIATFDQVLEIKPASYQVFELKKIKGIFQFFMISETAFVFPQFELQDSIPEDSVALPINVYQGATRCEAPIKDTDFAILKDNLNKSNFEFKKVAYLEKTIGEHCFRVEQLRYLISHLELEDNKLKIVELAVDHLYDFDRASLIAEDFFLERNKTKVKALFQ